MNPLAPGPWPGTPVFEWHTREVTCGHRFTDAEAEQAASRRRREAEQKALRARHRLETRNRIENLERERDAALDDLPPVNRPDPVKEEVAAKGCSLGCGLWAVLLGASLIVLWLNGQLDSDDPAILGVENPLVFLPAAWLVGWVIAAIRLASAKGTYEVASTEADIRAAVRAEVEADFERRIAAVKRSAQQ
ncbi:MAG TPA: hypothetical protein VFY69_06340 [Solirubrobacterales bacterium]|nr:hypothetical protein [Solirubrobacterales bacterium]